MKSVSKLVKHIKVLAVNLSNCKFYFNLLKFTTNMFCTATQLSYLLGFFQTAKKPHLDTQAFCEPCDREFKTQPDYQHHLSEHKTVSVAFIINY